jgi:hypothetical protein
MFDPAEYTDFVMAGYDKYFADNDVWLESKGKLGGNVDLRDVLKPNVWLEHMRHGCLIADH